MSFVFCYDDLRSPRRIAWLYNAFIYHPANLSPSAVQKFKTTINNMQLDKWYRP